MDSKQNFEKTTPSKSIINSLHGRLAHSTFNSDSPFRRVSNFSTPPSRFAKIKNPFEPHLSDRLHTQFCSPSVFQISSPKSEEKFKWTIDDISSLQPADIDETELEHYESPKHDSVMESQAQAKIDRFFSEHMAPSPYIEGIKPQPLILEGATPYKVQRTYSDSAAQTVLSLPPKLPEHVEMVLKPYFSYFDCQQPDQNLNASLHRKLFEFEEHDHETSSIQSSPPHSLHLSPIRPLPNHSLKVDLDDKCGSPTKLDECNLSPIEAESSLNYGERKSATRLNFSGYMSVDTSMNVVPDTADQMPRNDITNFDSTNSPLPEVLSDSTVNWDMEYKHITLRTPSKFDKHMDVSSSDTPKSKIFTSQRKKLSDSFLKDDYEDKENLEEQQLSVESEVVIRQKCLYTRQDSADAGYHTGILQTAPADLSWDDNSNFMERSKSHRTYVAMKEERVGRIDGGDSGYTPRPISRCKE